MISLYSADKPYKVYKESIWWSDKWDPLEEGQNFDFNRPFFEQFDELLHKVPRRGMHQDGTNENSQYTTFGMSNRNCYMSYAGFYCEDVYFSAWNGMCKNVIDCLLCVEGELLYECINCRKTYKCFYCKDCINCHDSYFLEDCRNCAHCICCKNLRNKEYYIYNKKISKQEYETFAKTESEKEKFEQWKIKQPSIYSHIEQSENCDGDYIENSKDCHDCFDIILGAENSRHCQYSGWNGKDMMDCSMCGKGGELLYEMQATVGSYNTAFTNFCRFCRDTYYCDCISSCHHCFGCTGLNHKEYCILNKQYAKEEYETLVPKIVEHMIETKEWGEFFPASISPFGYNETLAYEYSEIPKETAWKDPEDKKVSHKQDNALTCTKCGKNFKIISQESDFYKKLDLPIPKLCPDCRHNRRMRSRNPHKLFERKCANCKTGLFTSYSPDRPEKIYCEKCYLEVVY